jgi:hypothetical protein
MNRREWKRAIALAGAFLAAAWLIAGCGENPMGPSSLEDTARVDTAADPGGSTLAGAPPAGAGSRGVRVASLRVDRRIDGGSAVQPDVVRAGPRAVQEAFNPGRERIPAIRSAQQEWARM